MNIFFNEMEMFDCTFEIEVEQKKQTQTINAPRFVIEQQFRAYIQEASRSNEPIRIKLYRKVPIYDNFDNKWIEREVSITFENKSYEAKNRGGTSG